MLRTPRFVDNPGSTTYGLTSEQVVSILQSAILSDFADVAAYPESLDPSKTWALVYDVDAAQWTVAELVGGSPTGPVDFEDLRWTAPDGTPIGEVGQVYTGNQLVQLLLAAIAATPGGGGEQRGGATYLMTIMLIGTTAEFMVEQFTWAAVSTGYVYDDVGLRFVDKAAEQITTVEPQQGDMGMVGQVMTFPEDAAPIQTTGGVSYFLQGTPDGPVEFAGRYGLWMPQQAALVAIDTVSAGYTGNLAGLSQPEAPLSAALAILDALATGGDSGPVTDRTVANPGWGGLLAALAEVPSPTLAQVFAALAAQSMPTAGHRPTVRSFEPSAEEIPAEGTRHVDVPMQSRVFALLRVWGVGGDMRVRLYTDSARRTADAARPEGVDPVGDHGVLLDVLLGVDEVLDLAPGVIGHTAAQNSETWGTTVYMAITNRSTTGSIFGPGALLYWSDLVPAAS